MLPLLNQKPIQKVDLFRGQYLPWHKAVDELWNLSRYKVVSAGRKARKTTYWVNKIFSKAMTDTAGLTYPIIGPSRVQEKEIVWDDHVDQVLKILDKHGIQYTKNNSDLSVRIKDGGKVMIDGSDNIESLRGKSDWGGVYLDEFSSWRNPRYAWEDVIEPNLLPNMAWAGFGSTPKGYNYFHLLMKRGDHLGMIEGDAFDKDGKIVNPHPAYASFRFTSYDNPYLNVQWLNDKRDTLPADVFAREYLARFEKYSGLIYKEFSREHHIIEPIKIPVGWQRFRAMDFGATNPTVCLWIAVDGDMNLYVYDEYYQAEQSIEYHANVIKARTNNQDIVTTWGDPSGEQAILDYALQHVYITPAVKETEDNEKNWVRSGIDRTRRFLKLSHRTGKPKLFVFRTCTNLIREFESYRWMEKKDMTIQDENDKEVPLKANDHGMDALRYFICSQFAGQTIGDRVSVWQ